MKKITLLFLCILFFSHNNTITQNDIFADVRAGNKQAVKKRLENCEDCAVRDDHGNNALHVAAQEGNDEIIEILTTNLSYADFSSWLYSWFSAPTLPDINEINDDGDSPLLCTMYKGDLESAKCLVNKGASIEIVNKKGFSAPFVAMIKDDPRFIPIFVAHTLNLDHHRRNGDTIFHAAIKEKKPNVIHYCARETALSNSLNKDNKTPVFLAIDTENEEILNLFKKEQLNNSIHYAVHNNKYKALNYLLAYNKDYINEPDAHGNTPLFYAKDEMMFDFLLNYNADINMRNKQGEDLLAVATRKNNIPLMNALTKKYNVDINARDNKGQTSIMRAGIEQNHQAMKTLIGLGANIRITDNVQETVLHKIARKGDRDAAKIALEVDERLLTDVNKDGNSPLFVAIANGHMTFAEFLIDAGASVNDSNNNKDTILHEIVKKNNNWLLKKILKKVNQNIINQKNRDGMSPLLLAAVNDGVDTVRSLMEYRVNIYATDTQGNTIAHIAAEHGNDTLIQLLLPRKDLLNAHNNKGENVFIYGAQKGKLEVIKLLLMEDHFINGDVYKVIHNMHNIYRTHDQQEVYTYLLNLNEHRINECRTITAIATETSNVIIQKNNVSKILSEKTYQPYHPESLYSYYSENDLYKMTQTERNNVKNICLERQNRELMIKSTLEQKLEAIVVEEQRKELERIAADKYAADIAKNNQRIAEEQNRAAESIAVPEPIMEASCCICFEENVQLLKKIPCKNVHSDHICGACLAAPSIKTCPICRGPLTK